MINIKNFDRNGINLNSRYISNVPSEFQDGQKGRTPEWQLSYGTWLSFKQDIMTAPTGKRHKVCARYMGFAGLCEEQRQNFYHAVKLTTGKSVSQLRAMGQTLEQEGCRF